MKNKGEDSVLRTAQEFQRKVADLLVPLRPAKSLNNGAEFSGKLEQTGPACNNLVVVVKQTLL